MQKDSEKPRIGKKNENPTKRVKETQPTVGMEKRSPIVGKKLQKRKRTWSRGGGKTTKR